MARKSRAAPADDLVTYDDNGRLVHVGDTHRVDVELQNNVPVYHVYELREVGDAEKRVREPEAHFVWTHIRGFQGDEQAAVEHAVELASSAQ